MSRQIWQTNQHLELEATVAGLNARYAETEHEELLEAVIKEEFPGRIALVSSFGAEAALLLDMVARVDPGTPVLFLDTGKHFEATLAYRDQLIERLGLRDVRVLRPKPEDVKVDDPDGELYSRHPDLCCHIRKTLPLIRGLRGFDAWITGLKRIHGGPRAKLARFETQDDRIKINPLVAWDRRQIEREFKRRKLPPHPLKALGYLSIGCSPCTIPVKADEGLRSGRWQGWSKTECGIHVPSIGSLLAREPDDRVD